MNDLFTIKLLKQAINERNCAKLTLNILEANNRKYSQAWKEAEADLNYWQGKIVNYEAMLDHLKEAK